MTGTVKWFNAVKGYGFIISDDDAQELFVHYSAILKDGFKTLKDGQRVSFEQENDTENNRSRAINVMIME